MRYFLATVFYSVLLVQFANADGAKVFDGDRLQFGQADSEKNHQFFADRSETIKGGLGESALRLLPQEKENWEGGRVRFVMKVDPKRQNYFTVRLWGDDVSTDKLILYCDGKQIGYRHLGETDILDLGAEEPTWNGRFCYCTSPLPVSLTNGKTELQCEIRATGPIWGYGDTFEKYQKPMTAPSRGVYGVYTHTEPLFTPPKDEKQGAAPTNSPLRKEPGEETLGEVKKRVNDELTKLLAAKKPLTQPQLHFLVRAYFVKWSKAYQNPAVVETAVRSCDGFYESFRKDVKIAHEDPATYNPGWNGLGMAGDVIRRLSKELQPKLDEKLADGVVRREAWSKMLQESRDWNRRHRRQYTNQSMIVDLNIYRSNRGIAAVDPKSALPEKDMLRYLYESVGLEPWLGSETERGPEKPLGDDYYQLTAKGLTKELGFVGYYGEVLDLATDIYLATCEEDWPGDARLKKQLEKMSKARAAFRYPTVDEDGCRAMRIETIVGWRDTHIPGDVTYGQRASWGSCAIEAAAVSLDADSVGFAQQMIDDNQFFASVKKQMRTAGLRTTDGVLCAPDDFATIRSQPASENRLPMSVGQPDYVFSDEEDGVVAVKHGDEILYASLYWRARHAVNYLARVHYMTPTINRVAVVRQETEYEPSGKTYVRPDWTDFGFANGGHRYPGEFHSAHAGEKLPIAKGPHGEMTKPGEESVYAGKGTFYTLRYGPYLIAMNMSADKTFSLNVPAEAAGTIEELVERRKDVRPGETIQLGPRTTRILRFEKSENDRE